MNDSVEREGSLDVARIRSLILDVRKKLPRALWTDVPQMIDKDVLHVQLTYVPNGMNAGSTDTMAAATRWTRAEARAGRTSTAASSATMKNGIA